MVNLYVCIVWSSFAKVKFSLPQAGPQLHSFGEVEITGSGPCIDTVNKLFSTLCESISWLGFYSESHFTIWKWPLKTIYFTLQLNVFINFVIINLSCKVSISWRKNISSWSRDKHAHLSWQCHCRVQSSVLWQVKLQGELCVGVSILLHNKFKGVIPLW